MPPKLEVARSNRARVTIFSSTYRLRSFRVVAAIGRKSSLVLSWDRVYDIGDEELRAILREQWT